MPTRLTLTSLVSRYQVLNRQAEGESATEAERLRQSAVAPLAPFGVDLATFSRASTEQQISMLQEAAAAKLATDGFKALGARQHASGVLGEILVPPPSSYPQIDVAEFVRQYDGVQRAATSEPNYATAANYANGLLTEFGIAPATFAAATATERSAMLSQAIAADARAHQADWAAYWVRSAKPVPLREPPPERYLGFDVADFVRQFDAIQAAGATAPQQAGVAAQLALGTLTELGIDVARFRQGSTPERTRLLDEALTRARAE